MCCRPKAHDFHESYYEHSCSVVAERDVLYIDIRGTSFKSKFRRWWHDLFLLSYSDERSRLFYTSSHSMRKNRQRHFRKYRGRIHPLSNFRIYWEFMMVIVFIMNKLTFHHNTSFVFGDLYYSFYFIGAILELIILCDLFINLATGYIDEQSREIILDKHAGVLHYCSTKLFFHVASAMPLQWLIFVRYGSNYHCSLCKTSKFISTLNAISLLDLFRLYECTQFWLRKQNSYKVYYFLKFLRISVIALFTMFQFIEMTDTLTLRIMVMHGRIEEKSFVATVLKYRYESENHPDVFKFFIYDFARICRSILLFSYAYRKMSHYMDRIIALIAYMIANMFYLWTVAECYALICQLKFPEDRELEMKNSMFNMVCSRQLSDKVSARLYKYYDFNFAKIKTVEQRNHLYKAIPMVLKKEQYKTCYSGLLLTIPYFVEWPRPIKNPLVHKLKEEIYLKHDLVAEPNIQSEGLYIVASGELAVYTSETETGHLIDGDYFGELSLVTDQEIRTSSVIALTPCLILILEKSPFRRYMRLYPELFFKMKRQLKDKFGYNSSQTNASR